MINNNYYKNINFGPIPSKPYLHTLTSTTYWHTEYEQPSGCTSVIAVLCGMGYMFREHPSNVIRNNQVIIYYILSMHCYIALSFILCLFKQLFLIRNQHDMVWIYRNCRENIKLMNQI